MQEMPQVVASDLLEVDKLLPFLDVLMAVGGLGDLRMLLNVHRPFNTLRDIIRTFPNSVIVMNKLSRP